METILTTANGQAAVLFLAGVLIGIFAAVIGGGFFISVPFLQLLFPTASFGVIIGNLKIASLVRGLGTLSATRNQINWRETSYLAMPIVLGSFAGATCIAQLSQKWVFPVMLLAVISTEFAKSIAPLLTRRFAVISSLLVGVYAGFLGAGVGLILLSLMRLRYPEDNKICWIKIQVRFIELLACSVAVAAHILHGNIVFAVFFYYSIGAFFGGSFGGTILKRLSETQGGVQKGLLRCAFIFALYVSANAFIS